MNRVSPTSIARVTSRYDFWIIGGLCVLLVAVVTAMAALWRYKNTPGLVAEPQELWPADSRIERRAERPTLLMFAHPKCPCTVASLSEFRELMSDFGGGIDAIVLFLRPSGVDDDWMKSWVASLAASIQGVRTLEDFDGQESRLFGARTSGHVFLYGTDGRLLFSGGITGSRGHVGDNPGFASIASRLAKAVTIRACSEVFGCPLNDPEPK